MSENNPIEPGTGTQLTDSNLTAPATRITPGSAQLLGPVRIRELAAQLGIKPTKTLGQNFVHDAGTVRRIVRDAGVGAADAVVEVGPGLGSLTLALLETGAFVSAVEIDPPLAAQIPHTVAEHMPRASSHFAVVERDALQIVSAEDFARPAAWSKVHDAAVECAFEPTHLVANLPYNVAVPILLNFLERVPSLRSITVMVQAEVAERLAAQPGSKVYGIPSVKAAWYARVWRGAKISRNVFWPVPNVDSALVHFARHDVDYEQSSGVRREDVFAVVDAAFAQRRKTLRSALASWAGSAQRAEDILREAGVNPQERGEKLAIDAFVAIARAAASS